MIQYASDLHLDHFPGLTPSEFTEFLLPSAPTLILAGDIASAWSPIYYAFLVWCSNLWDHVIVVAGNHEYHCEPGFPHTRNETDTHIQQCCSMRRNLHFLQHGAGFTLPGTKYIVLGTTLYSDIDPAIYKDILGKSDFRNSYTLDTTIQPLCSGNNPPLRYTIPADLTHLHHKHKQALSDAIRALPRGYKAIVVTHYMPTEHLLEHEYRTEAWRSCYASSIDSMIRPPVYLWICGHSHRQARYTTPSGICVAMNARGYNKPKELERIQDIYSPYARVQLGRA
jgi:hypothetical protein